MSKNEDSTLFIMIHSYKGGTGKTSLSVNIAQSFAKKEKKKVLLIEQDIGGASFTDIFGISPKYYWNDFYNKNTHLKDMIIKNDLFDIICSNENEIEIPANQDVQSYFLRQLERFKYEKTWLRNNYDVVIFDTHPGYTVGLINSIYLAEIIILVTRRDSDVLQNSIDLYRKIYAEFQSKKIIVVENQVPEPIPNLEIGKMDRKYREAIKEWEKFLVDKPNVTIPLKNEIAYPLSLSKQAPVDNILFDYIEKIINIIKGFK